MAKLTVLGSTGATGRRLLSRALDAGYRVTAVVRRPDALPVTHANLNVVVADVTDPQAMSGAVRGAVAVLSTLGSRQMCRPTTLYSAAARAALAAMAETGVTRLVCVSAIPAEPDELKSPLERHVIHPLLFRFFGGGYDDMRVMEAELRRSSTNWTAFRPPYLTDAKGTGTYRFAVDAPLKGAWSISRDDLAKAMLESLDNQALFRHAVAIAH